MHICTLKYKISVLIFVLNSASISGGAYSEHETLKDNFRKNYNWFDAVKGLEEPGDAVRFRLNFTLQILHF